MIIDGHCHAGRGERLTAPWNSTAPLRTYLQRARSAGIDRTVVFSPFAGDYASANAEVARIVAGAPDRLIGFACVHPRRDAGRVQQLVGRAIREWGFRGIKVHRLDAPATREVCEVARAHRVPLLYDVAGQPELLELAATEHPTVTFLVPHLGSFADDWRAHQRLIDQMCRLPNVLADTSGVRRFDYLQQAVRRAGPTRLVFGTDGPWLHPAVELAKVRLLDLDGKGQALVLGGNLRRVLRLGAPTGRQLSATR
jgi:uncharacterized protein